MQTLPAVFGWYSLLLEVSISQLVQEVRSELINAANVKGVPGVLPSLLLFLNLWAGNFLVTPLSIGYSGKNRYRLDFQFRDDCDRVLQIGQRKGICLVPLMVDRPPQINYPPRHLPVVMPVPLRTSPSNLIFVFYLECEFRSFLIRDSPFIR